MAGQAGQKRREYVLPDLSAVQATQIVTDPNEIRALAPVSGAGRPAAERTPLMLELDEKCRTLHAAWITAGSPAEFAKSPLGKIHVPPDQVEGLRFLLRKSAEFVKVGLQYGNPSVKDRGGRIVVSFRCPDKRARKAKDTM
jgi:hypothetical protein